MIRRWLARRYCRLWFVGHRFEWERHDDRPSALVCRRCGHREENGLAWCLRQFLR